MRRVQSPQQQYLFERAPQYEFLYQLDTVSQSSLKIELMGGKSLEYLLEVYEIHEPVIRNSSFLFITIFLIG